MNPIDIPEIRSEQLRGELQLLNQRMKEAQGEVTFQRNRRDDAFRWLGKRELTEYVNTSEVSPTGKEGFEIRLKEGVDKMEDDLDVSEYLIAKLLVDRKKKELADLKAKYDKTNAEWQAVSSALQKDAKPEPRDTSYDVNVRELRHAQGDEERSNDLIPKVPETPKIPTPPKRFMPNFPGSPENIAAAARLADEMEADRLKQEIIAGGTFGG